MPAAKDNRPEEIPITDRLNDFIQKNRSKLLIGLLAVIVILAGFIVVTTMRDKVRAGALSKVDAFNRRYEALKPYIAGEEAASKQSDVDALLEELAVFAAKNSGFAAARAYTISAGIYWDEKNWAEAQKAWLASAEVAAKTYLAPVSICNAAVAAEEQGDVQSAIDLYTRAIDTDNSFPAAARSQFSIGRLEESRNNPTAALEAYRTLVSKWPDDPVWSNLAQSRIVVLSD